MHSKTASRKDVIKASRTYYAHRAHYEDLLDQGASARLKLKRELDFLEFAFHTEATRPVTDVLDVACGNGKHVIGLTRRGFRCTGQDYTPERIQVAKTRAAHEGVDVKLLQGDATKIKYKDEFDAVLALYILFLLPDEEDVLKCLRQIHDALKPGGITICNVFNPVSRRGHSHLRGYRVQQSRARGIRCIDIDHVEEFDEIRGVTWWQETSVIEAPDGVHVFRDRERIRLFTYHEILCYLQTAGFREINCFPDWKSKPPKKPRADWLVFVARKD
jgi:2-polyprenyl-3-methyl-5-hydroxy-6-metoxy-1,4-benzoquinol methylase